MQNKYLFAPERSRTQTVECVDSVRPSTAVLLVSYEIYCPATQWRRNIF